MTAQNSFKNSITLKNLTINSGQTLSQGFSCGELQNPANVGGFSSVVQLRFPANWTTCDVTFRFYSDNTYATAYTPTLPDGVTNDLFVMPACAALHAPILQPLMFIGVDFFKINCSVAQDEDTEVIVVLQPLTQVGG